MSIALIQSFRDAQNTGNPALMLGDLDKALRSSLLEERCQAIVLVPRVFDSFPFPHLVNEGFLKLAELFRRTNNNHVRFRILKAVQLAVKHVKKIGSIDEVFQRIHSVMHSNDPLARALTLRMLGCFTQNTAEQKAAHHSILTSLGSLEDCEVQAAVYAAGCFSSCSGSFTTALRPILTQMIQDLDTPADLKVQLAGLFKHAHHDLNTIEKSRNTCLQLLQEYPTKDLVETLLSASTEISSNSIVHKSDQVKLLVDYATNDLRRSVRLQALRGLGLLATSAAQEFEAAHIKALNSVLATSPHGSARIATLQILETLSVSCAGDLLIETGSVDHIRANVAHQHIGVACGSSTVICKLAFHALEDRDANQAANSGTKEEALVTHAFEAALNTISRCTSESGPFSQQKPTNFSLRSLLDAVTHVVAANPNHAAAFLDELVTVVIHTCKTDASLAIKLNTCLQRCINVVRITTQQVGLLLEALQDISVSGDRQVAIELCTTLLLCNVTKSEPDKLNFLVKAMQSSDQDWQLYCLAKRLSGLGCYTLAAQTYDWLSNRGVSDKYYMWLKCLKHVCEAEIYAGENSKLENQRLLIGLSKATASYHKALGLAGAARDNTTTCRFQRLYINLRIGILNVLHSVVKLCDGAVDITPGGNDVLQVVKEINSVVFQVFIGVHEFFDIDPKSYNILMQSRLALIVVAKILMTNLSGTMPDIPPIVIGKTFSAVSQSSIGNGKPLQQYISDMLLQIGEISSNDMVFSKALSVIKRLCSTPHQTPSYFFTHIRSTDIQISLSPSTNPGQELKVEANTELVIGIEGVVRYGRKNKELRRAMHVGLGVKMETGEHGIDTTIYKSEKRVPLTSSFFDDSVVISMPAYDAPETNCTIVIVPFLVDNLGQTWTTSNKQELFLKVVPNIKGPQH